MNLTDDPAARIVADLNAKAAQLRRRTLLPLILGWATVIAAIIVDHFRPGEYLILVTLPLLGAGTFNFITGWPIKRR